MYEVYSVQCISYLREGGGGKIPPPFFLHHLKMAQLIKLKLSDFKDTSLRHILQVMTICYILSCYHGNKTTQGAEFDSKEK